MAARKQRKRKGPGTRYILQRHAPDDLSLPTRLHLLKLLPSPHSTTNGTKPLTHETGETFQIHIPVEARTQTKPDRFSHAYSLTLGYMSTESLKPLDSVEP